MSKPMVRKGFPPLPPPLPPTRPSPPEGPPSRLIVDRVGLPRWFTITFWLGMILVVACAGLQLDVTHAGKRYQIETTPDEEGDQAVSITVTDEPESVPVDSDDDDEEEDGADPTSPE